MTYKQDCTQPVEGMLHVYYMGKFLTLWASLRPERKNKKTNEQTQKIKKPKHPNKKTSHSNAWNLNVIQWMAADGNFSLL